MDDEERVVYNYGHAGTARPVPKRRWDDTVDNRRPTSPKETFSYRAPQNRSPLRPPPPPRISDTRDYKDRRYDDSYYYSRPQDHKRSRTDGGYYGRESIPRADDNESYRNRSSSSRFEDRGNRQYRSKSRGRPDESESRKNWDSSSRVESDPVIRNNKESSNSRLNDKHHYNRPSDSRSEDKVLINPNSRDSLTKDSGSTKTSVETKTTTSKTFNVPMPTRPLSPTIAVLSPEVIDISDSSDESTHADSDVTMMPEPTTEPKYVVPQPSNKPPGSNSSKQSSLSEDKDKARHSSGESRSSSTKLQSKDPKKTNSIINKVLLNSTKQVVQDLLRNSKGSKQLNVAAKTGSVSSKGEIRSEEKSDTNNISVARKEIKSSSNAKYSTAEELLNVLTGKDEGNPEELSNPSGENVIPSTSASFTSTPVPVSIDGAEDVSATSAEDSNSISSGEIESACETLSPVSDFLGRSEDKDPPSENKETNLEESVPLEKIVTVTPQPDAAVNINSRSNKCSSDNAIPELCDTPLEKMPDTLVTKRSIGIKVNLNLGQDTSTKKAHTWCDVSATNCNFKDKPSAVASDAYIDTPRTSPDLAGSSPKQSSHGLPSPDTNDVSLYSDTIVETVVQSGSASQGGVSPGSESEKTATKESIVEHQITPTKGSKDVTAEELCSAVQPTIEPMCTDKPSTSLTEISEGTILNALGNPYPDLITVEKAVVDSLESSREESDLDLHIVLSESESSEAVEIQSPEHSASDVCPLADDREKVVSAMDCDKDTATDAATNLKTTNPTSSSNETDSDPIVLPEPLVVPLSSSSDETENITENSGPKSTQIVSKDITTAAGVAESSGIGDLNMALETASQLPASLGNQKTGDQITLETASQLPASLGNQKTGDQITLEEGIQLPASLGNQETGDHMALEKASQLPASLGNQKTGDQITLEKGIQLPASLCNQETGDQMASEKESQLPASLGSQETGDHMALENGNQLPASLGNQETGDHMTLEKASQLPASMGNLETGDQVQSSSKANSNGDNSSSATTSQDVNYPVLSIVEVPQTPAVLYDSLSDEEAEDPLRLTIRTDVFIEDPRSPNDSSVQRVANEVPSGSAPEINSRRRQMKKVVEDLQSKFLVQFSNQVEKVKAEVDRMAVEPVDTFEDFQAKLDRLLCVTEDQYRLIDGMKSKLFIIKNPASRQGPHERPTQNGLDPFKLLTIDSLSEYFSALLYIDSNIQTNYKISSAAALNFLRHRICRILHYYCKQRPGREEVAVLTSLDLLYQSFYKDFPGKDPEWTQDHILRAWDSVRFFPAELDERAIKYDHEKVGSQGFLKKAKVMVKKVKQEIAVEAAKVARNVQLIRDARNSQGSSAGNQVSMVPISSANTLPGRSGGFSSNPPSASPGVPQTKGPIGIPQQYQNAPMATVVSVSNQNMVQHGYIGQNAEQYRVNLGVSAPQHDPQLWANQSRSALTQEVQNPIQYSVQNTSIQQSVQPNQQLSNTAHYMPTTHGGVSQTQQHQQYHVAGTGIPLNQNINQSYQFTNSAQSRPQNHSSSFGTNVGDQRPNTAVRRHIAPAVQTSQQQLREVHAQVSQNHRQANVMPPRSQTPNIIRHRSQQPNVTGNGVGLVQYPPGPSVGLGQHRMPQQLRHIPQAIQQPQGHMQQRTTMNQHTQMTNYAPSNSTMSQLRPVYANPNQQQQHSSVAHQPLQRSNSYPAVSYSSGNTVENVASSSQMSVSYTPPGGQRVSFNLPVNNQIPAPTQGASSGIQLSQDMQSSVLQSGVHHNLPRSVPPASCPSNQNIPGARK